MNNIPNIQDSIQETTDSTKNFNDTNTETKGTKVFFRTETLDITITTYDDISKFKIQERNLENGEILTSNTLKIENHSQSEDIFDPMELCSTQIGDERNHIDTEITLDTLKFQSDRISLGNDTLEIQKNNFNEFLGNSIGVLDDSSEKPHKCDLCPKSFRKKQRLNEHRRVHTGEKPYTCDFCSRNFRTKQDFNVHRRIHTGERPYKCEVCSETFNQKRNFARHKLIHTGQKPYGCQLCEKRFRWKSDLTRHERIHSGKRPYNCSLCPKTFRHKSALDRHLLVHEKRAKKALELAEKTQENGVEHKDDNPNCDDEISEESD